MQTVAELPHLTGSGSKLNGGVSDKRTSEEPDDFEDVMTLIIALEKVESWLFCRVVECVW